MAAGTNLTELTAFVVAYFVSNNPLTSAELPAVISLTHAALLRIDSIRTEAAPARKPAVPAEKMDHP